MLEKYCLIRQPAGLGDICFCQKIAKKLITKDWKIIWPVIKQYEYIKHYIKDIEFPLVTDDFKLKEYYNNTTLFWEKNILFIPLQDADKIIPFHGILSSKYELVGLKLEDWSDYLTFERNIEREEKLYKHFNLKDNEKYNLINCKYGTPPESFEIKPITPKNDYRNISMNSVGFDNVFDWCKLIENAQEIHTVNTCFCIIIEKLKKSDNLFMYNRGNQSNFNYLNGLFKKPWKYIL